MIPRLLKFLLLAALGLALASVLIVLALRVIPPPTTAFMVASDHRPVEQQWVPWSRIAPAAALAVVASEDQKFPDHWGFDFEAIDAARQHNARSHHMHGASTISQQTAKNLFLWSGRSYLRKGLEAGFTLLLEGLWPKHRILETYLNIAQFGPGIYGVQVAAARFFHTDAAHLGEHQAALLAAVLPDPDKLHADHPSEFVAQRAAEIEEQMRLLGTDYLARLP